MSFYVHLQHTVQYSPVIYDPLSEMCNVQHRKNHLLKMQQFSGLFQKIKSNFLLKWFSYFWIQLCNVINIFNFLITSFVICYHARKIIEISKFCCCFYWSYLLLECLILGSFYLIFFHIHFNCITSSNLSYCINDTF